MSLVFERWYPWLWGGFFAALLWLLDISLPKNDSLLSAAISVSAILVGFLATMKSIIMAVPAVVEKLRAADYLQDLARYLSEATIFNLGFCILNISGFFPWIVRHPFVFSTIWFFTGVVALLTFWRVTHVMVLVLQWKPK